MQKRTFDVYRSVSSILFIFEILLHKSTPLVNGVVIRKMLKELEVEWGRVELYKKGLEISWLVRGK